MADSKVAETSKSSKWRSCLIKPTSGDKWYLGEIRNITRDNNSEIHNFEIHYNDQSGNPQQQILPRTSPFIEPIPRSYNQLTQNESGIKIGAHCEVYRADPNKKNIDWYPGQILCVFTDTKSEERTKEKFVYVSHDNGWKSRILHTSERLIISTGTQPVLNKQISGNKRHKNGYDDILQQEQQGCKRIIQQCSCTKRIIMALHHYQTVNRENNEETRDNIVKFFKHVYKGLLNDFIHIITYHNDTIELEEIQEILLKDSDTNPCDISNCLMASRYHRDRTKDDIKCDDDEIHMFYRDIMDQIHCYLYHLFDMGLRRSSTMADDKLEKKQKKSHSKSNYESPTWLSHQNGIFHEKLNLNEV